MKNCVYVLQSIKDQKQYIGSSEDLLKRIRRHNQGLVRSTKNRRPLKLIAYRVFSDILEASIYEKKYKRSHEQLERDIKSGKFTILN